MRLPWWFLEPNSWYTYVAAHIPAIGLYNFLMKLTYLSSVLFVTYHRQTKPCHYKNIALNSWFGISVLSAYFSIPQFCFTFSCNTRVTLVYAPIPIECNYLIIESQVFLRSIQTRSKKYSVLDLDTICIDASTPLVVKNSSFLLYILFHLILMFLTHTVYVLLQSN